MKGGRTSVLTFAEKCKNILASNWQANLNTVKADAKGSKDEIYTSKVKYFVKKGRPYIWVPDDDLHNNTVIDERSSLAVTSPLPGSLASLLQSLKKPPNRIALVGELVPLGDKKVKSAAASLRETLISEGEALKAFSYSVTGILSSSDFRLTSRAENLQELLNEDQQYRVYKFNPSSITYIEGKENSHEVDLKDIEESKADSLSLFSASLIDGINQSEARRRALMIFCATYLNKHVKDALVLSVDRKGLDVLGKFVGPMMDDDGSHEYQWKELRLMLKEEAPDVETFCKRLVEMEEEAIKNVSSFSGLPLEPKVT
ncbi:putative FMN-binding split barrel, hem oxygenase HugZ-like superfamily [Helianthus anomalus]